MKIVIIDCFDSFTFNLVHYLEQMCETVDCIRCNRVDITSLAQYDGIVLSPGPGLPSETPNLYAILGEWGALKPILGVCLGHQAIGTFFGLDLINMPQVHHGIKRSTIVVDQGEILFRNIPTEFSSARYHSWVISKPREDSPLKPTAVDSDGSIMGISHCKYNIKGVQFHPESILTDYGFKMLENWVLSIKDYKL
jgi:anthranilate synthase component 2